MLHQKQCRLWRGYGEHNDDYLQGLRCGSHTISDVTMHLMVNDTLQVQCWHTPHFAYHSCLEGQSGTELFRSGIPPSSLSHRLQQQSKV